MRMSGRFSTKSENVRLVQHSPSPHCQVAAATRPVRIARPIVQLPRRRHKGFEQKAAQGSILAYIRTFLLALDASCAHCSRFRCHCYAAGPVAQLHLSSSPWQLVFCSCFSTPSLLSNHLRIHWFPWHRPSAAPRSGTLPIAPVGHPGLLQLLRNTILLFAALRVHAPSIGQQAAALPAPRLRRQAC